MIRNQRNNQNIILDSRSTRSTMMNCNPPSNKRRRIEKANTNVNNASSSSSSQKQQREGEENDEDAYEDLYALIESKDWAKAAIRAKQDPTEVSDYDTKREPSMLALCCRLGAPYYCIKEIVDASPTQLRHLVDARGTPLHEAIVCDDIGPKVIDYLLQVDEKLSLVQQQEVVATTTADTDSNSNSEDSSPQQLRATMMQDVDGYTPLHLLIRRRFQSYVLTEHEQSNNNNNNNINNENDEHENENENNEKRSTISGQFIEILELLVKSCPEATIIPDRGEYEEPPIVMAIKANVYAPMLLPPTQQQQQQQQQADNNNNNNNEQPGGGEVQVPEITTVTRIEQHIYDMVNCMLQYYPEAASNVFNGYRGQYTALHSAVFHGRCPNTIELILNAEKKASLEDATTSSKACLLGNTQGELPLHFCAMRGEPPRTVALLAKAAPEAIFQRDTSGLTPVHWLWIRFVSTLLTIEDGNGRGNSVTVPLKRTPQQEQEENFTFSSLEQDNFDADLQLLRRIDPSVDFLRMRHIPTEVQDGSDALQWAERTATLLKNVRDRFEVVATTTARAAATRNDEEQQQDDDNHRDDEVVILSRLEAVSTLFWIKVVSLLKAASVSGGGSYDGDLSLVRIAFESGCCPPLVARIVALLFPRELSQPDTTGRLALHYAAMRPWHAWEWPREDGTNDNVASSKLLNLESASLLRNAMSLSPVEVAKHKDNQGCLPIHYMISTCIQACCATGRTCSIDPLVEMMEIIGYFVKLNPSSLNVLDPRTNLLPYLQASAESATHTIMNNNNSNSNNSSSSIHEEFASSIVYLLLRQDPSLVQPA